MNRSIEVQGVTHLYFSRLAPIRPVACRRRALCGCALLVLHHLLSSAPASAAWNKEKAEKGRERPDGEMMEGVGAEYVPTYRTMDGSYYQPT